MKLKILIILLFSLGKIYSQTQGPGPVSRTTIVLCNDTTVYRTLNNSTNHGAQFLICKGVKVKYIDTNLGNGHFANDTFLMMDSSELTLDSIRTNGLGKLVFMAPHSKIKNNSSKFIEGFMDSSATVNPNSTIVRPKITKWTKKFNGEYFDFALWPGKTNPCCKKRLANTSLKNIEFNIWPNPATDQLFIETEIKNYWVEITDLVGRVTYQSNIRLQSRSSVDVSELQGNYLLIIHSGHKKLVRHILVNN